MFVNQKAQEISYALLRLAPYVRKIELRQRVERLAFQLLEDAASENFEQGLKVIAGLESLVSVGKALYEIEPVNAKVILGELNLLKSAMRQAAGLNESLDELPRLEEFFSKVPTVVDVVDGDQLQNQAIPDDMRQQELPQSNGFAATIRQSAIIEKIRQSANRQIQLKDLIAAFPEVSERTMRYDLQKLCLQGLIERIGNGGPASYYALK